MEMSLRNEINRLTENILEVRYTDLNKEAVLCQELLELATRENDVYGIAFANTYFGDYYIACEETEKSGYHLQIAKKACVENGFYELLMRVYNLLGICYELLLDEQTALQHYLLAIELSATCNCPAIECVLLNNIANNFEALCDYEEAEKYYIRACEKLESVMDMDNKEYIKLRIWGNMMEVFRSLNKPNSIIKYLDKCEKIGQEFETVKRIVFANGRCSYYTLVNEMDKATEQMDELILACQSKDCADRNFAFGMLFNAVKIMLEVRNERSADALLSYLDSVKDEVGIDKEVLLQKLKTRYYEIFGTAAEKVVAFEEYYKVMDSLERQTKQVKANGLKNILYLDDVKNSLTIEREKLENEAYLDELTKLYNRRSFNKHVSKCVLDEGTKRIGFIMLDVDYFKEYNDTYGHAKGDLVLNTLGEILNKNATEQIVPCRYGGDEFVCVCVNCEDEDIASFISSVREDLLKAKIENARSRCGGCLTLSIGYSNRFFEEGVSTAILLGEADEALYSSKNAGRNTSTRYDENKI